MREGINSPRLPAPALPFSHAVRDGDRVYLSGQVGLDESTGKLIAGDVSAQTAQVFKNIATVLADVGSSMDEVVKVNVYLVNMADFAAMNAVYAKQFAQPYPARTTVAVAGLPMGARVEIEVVARLRK
ncbi:RidA family protein [Vitiosangium sp. GDMCC 1.1324]|uniref:RidA family protein n=1 Tax=Vitiosangium sp. (strain GDMCC 1.1324) TaxID=2138576 RepID=UPI000D3D9AAA|nr:Rid family detoxifying hydrolase [Vitiosangium sp. GDMCC 1.1324]PTL79720.1 reactive intermediate/imine deaminase [Vitiosangium sp. GDMCC 1.1324]